MQYKPVIISRHPSHKRWAETLPRLPFRLRVRFGHMRHLPRDNKPNTVLINSPESCVVSADKKLMKEAFIRAGVSTAKWHHYHQGIHSGGAGFDFPMVAKYRWGSRGNGVYLLKSEQEFVNWSRGKTLGNYIFEKFHEYSREYRLHMTQDGCFYALRKMLKNNIPDHQRWYRNDSNSVWISESNGKFDKPVNWDEIVDHCKRALIAVGLEIGAFDVKVQSARKSNGRTRENPKFVLLEVNSAPSLGDKTCEKYTDAVLQLATSKYYNRT